MAFTFIPARTLCARCLLCLIECLIEPVARRSQKAVATPRPLPVESSLPKTSMRRSPVTGAYFVLIALPLTIVGLSLVVFHLARKAGRGE